MKERERKKSFSNVSKKPSDTERRLKQTLKEIKSIQSIVDSCPAVVFQRKASEGWPVEYISENVKQFGYSAREFISGQRLWSEIIYPDDVQRLGVKLKKYIKNNICEFMQEYRLFSSSGSLRWVEERIKAVINSKGKTTRYQGIILDITERKLWDVAVRNKAKNEVRSNERTIHTLLNATDDAIFLIDKDGTLLTLNKALATRLSKNTEDLLGMCVYNFLPQDLAKLRKKWIEHVIISRKPIRFEDKRNGVWLENFIYPIFTQNAVTMLAIFSRNITARKHNEQDRENLIERLQDYIAKTKSLRGLIPICSSCKRVKGDDGYWGQLEVYISEHSDAEFSHGLCPECAKKIYPDY